MHRQNADGFTLIELMVAVAIVAVLVAIAYPSYKQYIVRSNRAAAQAQMLDIANREQQFLLNTRGYVAHSDASWTAVYSLPPEVSKHYSYGIQVDNTTLPQFTITFQPISPIQTSDGALSYTSQGVRSPSSKW